MIVTDEKKIDEFLDRGVSAVYPTREYLKKELLSGKQLSIYLGVDPTGPNLHIGHMICLKKLSEFQKLGHKVIFLIGSFTAMIGDPTGKASTRKQLTRDDVLENCRKYREQASVYLNFEGENPVEMKYNSDWHDKLSFKDVVELSANFTVSQMLERDMFQERIKKDQPIGLHEFLYPLMQGYDSVAMNVDGEIGGNDQIFNMLCGRDLMKSLKNKEKFVIAMKLLTDSTGKKMGKSEGNMIALNDSSKDMFGKIMSWTDGMILSGFDLCTNVTTEQIEKYKQDLDNGVNPRDLKIVLAEEILKIYFGEDIAKQEVNNFISQFSEKKLPNNINELKVDINDCKIIDLIIKAKLVESKTQARSMIEQGAVKVYDKDENMRKITDINEIIDISKENIIQVGKLKYIKLV